VRARVVEEGYIGNLHREDVITSFGVVRLEGGNPGERSAISHIFPPRAWNMLKQVQVVGAVYISAMCLF